MRILSVVFLAVVIALATLGLGWWAVAPVAALWGLVVGRGSRVSSVGGTASLAAVLAWGALLAVDAASGNLGALGRLFGAIAKMPPAVFLVLTLVFPALVAWSAAALTASLWPRRERPRHYVPASRVLRGEAAARERRLAGD
jgi:hypothetical protein